MAARPIILIVEDERNFARVLEAQLRRSGFEVDVAGDAVGGANLLWRSHYDLVLLDLRLPDASGLEILPHLCAIAPDTPFLLMTAYEEENLRQRSLEAGAADILYKPFDLDVLLDAVRRTLAAAPRPAAGPAAPVAMVMPGQAVVLEVTGPPPVECPAQVTETRADTFAVMADCATGADPRDALQVTLTGTDGQYLFRSRVVTAEAEGRALVLTKPTVIRRRQRRRHTRALLRVPVQVRPTGPPDDSVLEGRTHDVGLGGMTLLAPRALAPGQSVRLDWQFPPPLAEEAQATGVVLRAAAESAGPQPAIYRMAIRFTRLPARVRALLSAYLRAASSV